MAARAGLIACLLDLGDYANAVFQARMAVSFEWERPAFQLARATADSALRAKAPPGTVRLAISDKFTIAPYMIVGARR